MEPPEGVVKRTVAPVTAAPEGSVTWPWIEAVGDCAASAPATQKNRRPARWASDAAFFQNREIIRGVFPFLMIDGACRESRRACGGSIPAAAVQTPRRKNRGSLRLR